MHLHVCNCGLVLLFQAVEMANLRQQVEFVLARNKTLQDQVEKMEVCPGSLHVVCVLLQSCSCLGKFFAYTM